MPKKATRRLSNRAVSTGEAGVSLPWKKAIERLLDREVGPLLRELAEAYNLAVGPVATTVTADTTITSEFQYWPVDAAAGVVTLTLPAADQWSMPVVVKRQNVGGSNVVVAVAGTDLIDGASSVSLLTGYDVLRLVSDEESGWMVV